MRKVVKFGGSSLASAEQFKKVGDIIQAEASRKFVVPSAPGKRFKGDTKVTDMLYGCYALAAENKDYHQELALIKARYDEIIEGLGLTLSLDQEFEIIDRQFAAKAGKDYAASRGEYLNGHIMAAYLGYQFVDAAEVVFFKENGEFDAAKTNEIMGERLKALSNAVVPGFYGSYPDGRVKTFSRGGSDITGSIVARAIQADVYENWTDVSGFLITDPNIIAGPEKIETITYKELRELSYMGAGVLHEDAIFPVRSEGIPINIRNTNAPDDSGTWIVESTCQKPRFIITGIAGKKGFCSITIEKEMMNAEIGFGRRALQAFEDNGISFEHMPSGIDTLTVFAHQDEFMHKEQAVVSALHRMCDPDHIDIEGDLSLIAVVGRGMKSTRGTAARIFSALAHANINVRMIDQGSSELNIIIGVHDSDFENAIRAIYNMFVLVQL
ncbi:MAG: aspartate kinase [Lachnospiraceae bacterium]|nr:aspartate kinase [Lachnospiraceae bacterium]